MITVDVQVDIDQAMKALNLLPKEAERAAYRAINKLADEVKKDSIQRIQGFSGINKERVADRFYIKGAAPDRLIAVVQALPSARNVGYEAGAFPAPGKVGVDVTAWRQRTLYDRAFVMGKQARLGVRRKVWRRTGPKPHQITDQVWGPSVRRIFLQPWLVKHNLEIIRTRWAYWFERYLRGEIVKLRGSQSLVGVTNVLPSIQGPTITET